MTSTVAFAVFDPGGIKATKRTHHVKVMMSEGLHDTAIITLQNQALDVPELQPGTPVQMQYGWSRVDTDMFYGYVDHIQTGYERLVQPAAITQDVVCLGTSYALKDPFVGAWQNVPASSVVEQIAQKYFLAVLIENDDFSWPSLASPGQSAWTFLNQLATKVGYSLAVNKTLLRFTSIDTAMKQRWVNMPVFQTRKTALSIATQSLIRFNVIQGDALPLSGKTKAVRTVSGMDPRTGQMVGAVDDGSSIDALMGASSVYPFFGQQISDQVVTSQGQAQALLAGMTQANRFTYHADASLFGMTTVKQGSPIVLTGIDTNNDGMWWVQEVTHKISGVSYSMDVVLGRDSLGDSGVRPIQPTAMLYSPSNPFTYSAINAPPTVLLGNRWRAANQSVTYVAG